MEVTYDGTCFGCGERNPNGLRMRFEPDGEESACELSVPERYQSWLGIVHGGMVALMLDEAVGWAAWHAGRPSVTGKLEVRLRQPLKVGERIRVAGRIERTRRNLVYTTAYVDRVRERHGFSVFAEQAAPQLIRLGVSVRMDTLRSGEEGPKSADSSSKRWSGAGDSNPGPHGPEPCALPDCASPRRREASNANSSVPEALPAPASCRRGS